MIRLFIGIEMPDWVSDELSRLGGGIPGARWVDSANHHLTLRFIGDVDGYQHDRIERSLGGIVLESFTLSIGGVGHFPPRGHAKVLWAGVDESDELNRLQRQIDRTLTSLQHKPEGRKWYPHVTLARLSSNGNGDRVRSFLQGNSLLRLEPFLVTSFQLYQSTLHPDGARYEVMRSYPLTG